MTVALYQPCHLVPAAAGKADERQTTTIQLLDTQTDLLEEDPAARKTPMPLPGTLSVSKTQPHPSWPQLVVSRCASDQPCVSCGTRAAPKAAQESREEAEGGGSARQAVSEECQCLESATNLLLVQFMPLQQCLE